MKKIMALVFSLIVAVGVVALSHRLSIDCPRPSLYARLSFSPESRELSLELTNIGKRRIFVPVGSFSIFVRPSPINARVAFLHVRLNAAGAEGDPAAALPLDPGAATSIDGLYRFLGRLSAERDTLYAVFEVAVDVGHGPDVWRGIVRSFPVRLRTGKM